VKTQGVVICPVCGAEYDSMTDLKKELDRVIKELKEQENTNKVM
jgi:uncharacterized Zn finger protein (UPF0148 family)